ncbi:MAG: hypothetical protein K940chlam1_00845 [Candidatus Anoxychlamydiales bacterium]|nr:hypothetical protein [Candidatus Anoxychlamydiales bacterium]NGX35973.1 hypothetical protein [Candidatus Anoxychlamydiales bacterium]
MSTSYKYAQGLVKRIDSINAGRSGELARWNKMIEGDQAVDEKAATERNQGWSSLLKASLQGIAIVAGNAFESSGGVLKVVGSVMKASANPIGEGLNIRTRMQDATITIKDSKIATIREAVRAIGETQSADDSWIARLTEHGARVSEHDR